MEVGTDLVVFLDGESRGKFILAFFSAPLHAKLQVGGGLADGVAFVIVSINGATAAMTPADARALADEAERVLEARPDDPKAAVVPALVRGLRMGADGAERLQAADLTSPGPPPFH